MNKKISDLENERRIISARIREVGPSSEASVELYERIGEILNEIELTSKEIKGFHGFFEEIYENFNSNILNFFTGLESVNLGEDSIEPFLSFSIKIVDLGIKDINEDNIGFSKERGVPVILDYGFDMDSVEHIYNNRNDYNFGRNSYFSSSSKMNPRNANSHRAEKVADQIGENSKNRIPYIQNSTVEEIKRIIEMIPTPEGILEFLEKFAAKIGTGSSRSAFQIAPNKVLKIAFNKAGRIQNEVEINSADELGVFVPRVYDFHPDAYWIEMEKAGDIGDAGWMIYDLIGYMRYMDPREEIISEVENNVDKYKDLYAIYEGLRLKNRDAEENEYFEELSELTGEFSIIKMMIENDLSLEMSVYIARMADALEEHNVSDLNPDNLGISLTTGMPVVIDFGFGNSDSDLSWIYASAAETREEKDPNFRPEDYFQSTSDMRPAR